MYCYLWKYRVRPECVTAFKELYGPRGAWVQLFSSSGGYLRTELLQDQADGCRFVSADYWTSQDECIAFRHASRREFDAIDARGDELTIEESLVGEFNVLGAGS